jgi:DNA-binding NtrC family response regulator
MDARQITVLLIEDDPNDALLIQRDLAGAMIAPFELFHASTLKSGLERLRNGGIDVVLLDLYLPDGEGIGLLEKVEGLDPHVPVIMLTGRDDDEVAVEAVHKGAQDYLVKGQVPAALLRRSIRYAIERKKLLTELARSAKEIKTLRGFLPICANCKKIRDDKGSWTQIETYISERSDAEFTHGLCPDCVTTLYGLHIDEEK